MRRFEYTDNKSSKFWQIEQLGCELHIRWGRIGTVGQHRVKQFESATRCAVAVAKLVAEKCGKGYVELQMATSLAPTPASAAPPASVAAPGSSRAVTTILAPDLVSAANVAGPIDTSLARPTRPPDLACDNVPPWFSSGTPVDIPAPIRARALPSRRFPQPIRPFDAQAAWETACHRTRASYRLDFTSSDVCLHSSIQLAWAVMSGEAVISTPEADAIMLLAAEALPHISDELCRQMLHCLVARRGLRWCIDVLLAMRRIARNMEIDSQGDRVVAFALAPARSDAPANRLGRLSPVEIALRHELALAPQAVWDECSAALRAALPGLPGQHQCSVVVLLPELPELANEVARRLARGGSVPPAAHWLLLTATSKAALNIARNTKIADDVFSCWAQGCLAATILLERGVDACEILAPGARQEVSAEALACIGTPQAIEVLASVAHHNRQAQKHFQAAMKRWPLASIAAMARLASGKRHQAPAWRRQLATLLAAHHEEVPVLLPWLEDDGRAVVAEVQDSQPRPRQVAANADLPRVLANPPWLGKRPPALPARKVAPLPLAATFVMDALQRKHVLGQLATLVQQRFGHPAPDIHQVLHHLIVQPARRARLLAHTGEQLRDLALAAIDAADGNALYCVWRGTRAWSLPVENVVCLPEQVAIAFWTSAAADNSLELYGLQGAPQLLARYGMRLLPALLTLIRRSCADTLPLALDFGAVELALPVAQAYAGLKKSRAVARTWLLKFPEHAACALIAPALGSAGADRGCALAALRLLRESGYAAMLDDIARRYADPGLAAAVKAALDQDPLELCPTKVGKLPGFWQPRAWQRPLLNASGGASAGLPLSDTALDHLGAMLRFPVVDNPYAGIAQVRSACSADSLAAFAWDCFRAWLDSGAPARDKWALAALGWFGNDDTARKLAPYLRAWPGEAAHARAVAGLDVLADIGSDVALMLLNGIAQKLKFKGLQDAARSKIAAIAEARGLTREELEDRLVPDCGLDASGSLRLDFGSRNFLVGFDEALKPWVRDGSGARLPDLPKPRKDDNPELARAASEQFKALKKDVRTIAALQLRRLEQAMCARRRWMPQEFDTLLVQHPLLRHLVSRLVWGVYEASADAGHGGRLLACFRVAEEGSRRDGHDDPFELAGGPGQVIGIVHPLEMPAADAIAFSQLLADYELLQPFPQIGRETATLDSTEATATRLLRWNGARVDSRRLLGLLDKGWRRLEILDAGMYCELFCQLSSGQVLRLAFEPGLFPGDVDTNPEQTLVDVCVGPAAADGTLAQQQALAVLDPIAASELIVEMERLCAPLQERLRT